jgi:hypothetical protein
MTTTEIEKEILRELVTNNNRDSNPASVDKLFSVLHDKFKPIFKIESYHFGDAKEELFKTKHINGFGGKDDTIWFTGAGKKWFEENVLEPEKAQRELDRLQALHPIAKPVISNEIKKRSKYLLTVKKCTNWLIVNIWNIISGVIMALLALLIYDKYFKN